MKVIAGVCLFFALLFGFYGFTRLASSTEAIVPSDCPTCPAEVNYAEKKAGKNALGLSGILLIGGVSLFVLGRKKK